MQPHILNIMNVLLINGSPNKKGCTFATLSEVAGELEKQSIETRIFHIATKAIRGCVACGKCKETGTGSATDKFY